MGKGGMDKDGWKEGGGSLRRRKEKGEVRGEGKKSGWGGDEKKGGKH